MREKKFTELERELLAALERLLMFTKGECLKYPEGISKVEQADAAIAKAYSE